VFGVGFTDPSSSSTSSSTVERIWHILDSQGQIMALALRKCRPILPTDALSCQPTPNPANRCHILLNAAISCQLTAYLAGGRHIHPTDSLYTQLSPYPANCRPILSMAVLSCQLTPYPPDALSGALPCQMTPYRANRRHILLNDALSCQPTTDPANRHPILLIDALFCQSTPYPVNQRSILPTDTLSC